MKKFQSAILNNLWEIIGYICIALCIIGQVAVGYLYIPAQICYLVANIASVVRNYALNLPRANKVKDICFSAITVGLIVIYMTGGAV
jgi:hypothetical protein